MTRPTFFEGAGLALVAALAGAGIFTVLAAVFAGGTLLRVLIAGIAFLYLLYLLRRSQQRVGRVTAVVIWTITAIAVWWLVPGLVAYTAAHVLMIWLIRSLYFYSSVVAALTDLALSMLALGAAVWAGLTTHSIFLSIWCFFLVQALFVGIPSSWRRHDRSVRRPAGDEDRFEHAHRIAEAALRRCSSTYL